MNIYSKPKVSITEDGTIEITCARLTPSCINELIENMDGYRKANFDFSMITETISNANGKEEGEAALRKKFKLTHSQARFMTEASIEETIDYCNNDMWKKTIDKYRSLIGLLLDEGMDSAD